MRPPPVGFTHHARNYDEAIALLSAETFEVVSFDHDLAEDHYHGDYSRHRTGADIARWVADRAAAYQLDRFRWRIHSLNEAGRVTIREALETADQFWSLAAQERHRLRGGR